VLAPVTAAVQFIVRRMLKLLGVDVDKISNVLSAHDELRGAINLHHLEGGVVKDDRDMLGGILDLRDLEVSDVMVHRTKMQTIDAALPAARIIEEVLSSGYTRMPVWTEDQDNIVGILHAKDVLKGLTGVGGDVTKLDVLGLISKPWFVPDTTSVPDQLNAFLKRKAHFAIVVDEYGEVMGLLTLEDILEEIVGEIADEHDVPTSGVRPQPDGAVNVDGTVNYTATNHAGYTDETGIIMQIVNGDWKLQAK
jgi:Mg2+/Co2+ transporter CorB